MGAEVDRLHAVAGVATSVVDVVSRGEDPATVLEPLRAIAPFDAAMISVRDPLTGAHRPIVVDGYDSAMVRYVNSGFLSCSGYRRAHLTRRALRVCDMPEFRGTQTYRGYLEPRGFREGVALVLRSGGPEGSLTGMLALSFAGPQGLDDDVRDALESVAPALARLTDVRLTPTWLRSFFAPSSVAAVIDAQGTPTAIPDALGVSAGAIPGALLAVVRDFLRGGRALLRGYHEDEAGWQRVQIVRVPAAWLGPEPRALIMLESATLPHQLTPRELDVLTLIAAGMRNREVGERLSTSPRTVGSHIEHLLLKTGLQTRAGLAAEAVDQGILRLPATGLVPLGALPSPAR